MNEAKVHTAGLLAPSFAYLWALDYTGHGPPLEPLCCLFLLPGMLSHQLFQVCLIYEWGNWVQRNDALLCNRQLQSGKVFPGSQISWFLINNSSLITKNSRVFCGTLIPPWSPSRVLSWDVPCNSISLLMISQMCAHTHVYLCVCVHTCGVGCVILMFQRTSLGGCFFLHAIVHPSQG